MANKFIPNPVTGIYESKWEFESREPLAPEFEGFGGDPNAPPETLPELHEVSKDTIDEAFQLVNVGGTARIVYRGRSALNPNWRSPQFMNPAHFSTLLANKYVAFAVTKTDPQSGEQKEVMEKVKLAKWWLGNGGRRTYDGLYFESDPAKAPANSVNLWRGYGVKEYESGAWSLLQQHIFEVIANRNEEHYAYIVRWIAYLIQHPTTPAEVALVLVSILEGTGKGTLGHAVCHLLGPHAMHASRVEDLTGKFNAHLAQCAFLFVDEAIWPGHKQYEGIMKAYITEPTLDIEPKGVDKFSIRNALSVLFASNHLWVVPAGEDARRYAVFEPSGHRKGDFGYFEAIRQQLYKEGGAGRMLYDLKRLDLTGFNVRNFPRTEALALQQAETAEPWQQWFGDILNDGVLPRHGLDDHLAPNEVMGSVLLADARRRKGCEWLSSQKLTGPHYLKPFGIHRHPNRKFGSRWRLPPLMEARKRWRTKYPWWAAFDDNTDDWAHAG